MPTRKAVTIHILQANSLSQLSERHATLKEIGRYPHASTPAELIKPAESSDDSKGYDPNHSSWYTVCVPQNVAEFWIHVKEIEPDCVDAAQGCLADIHVSGIKFQTRVFDERIGDSDGKIFRDITRNVQDCEKTGSTIHHNLHIQDAALREKFYQPQLQIRIRRTNYRRVLPQTKLNSGFDTNSASYESSTDDLEPQSFIQFNMAFERSNGSPVEIVLRPVAATVPGSHDLDTASANAAVEGNITIEVDPSVQPSADITDGLFKEKRKHPFNIIHSPGLKFSEGVNDRQQDIMDHVAKTESPAKIKVNSLEASLDQFSHLACPVGEVLGKEAFNHAEELSAFVEEPEPRPTTPGKGKQRATETAMPFDEAIAVHEKKNPGCVNLDVPNADSALMPSLSNYSIWSYDSLEILGNSQNDQNSTLLPPRTSSLPQPEAAPTVPVFLHASESARSVFSSTGTPKRQVHVSELPRAIAEFKVAFGLRPQEDRSFNKVFRSVSTKVRNKLPSSLDRSGISADGVHPSATVGVSAPGSGPRNLTNHQNVVTGIGTGAQDTVQGKQTLPKRPGVTPVTICRAASMGKPQYLSETSANYLITERSERLLVAGLVARYTREEPKTSFLRKTLNKLCSKRE